MDTIPSIQNLTPLDHREGDQNIEIDETEGMDKIFEGQGPYSEEFSVNELSPGPAGSSVWKPGYSDDLETQTREVGSYTPFRDIDLSSHRRDSFPHVHHPLKPSRTKRKGRRKGHHHKHHHGHRHHDKDEEDEEEDEVEEEEEDKQQDQLEVVDETEKTSGDVVIEVGDPDMKQGWSTQPVKQRSQTDPGVLSTDDEVLETSPLISRHIAKLRPCIRSETDTAGSEDEAHMLTAEELAAKKGRVKFDIGSDAWESEHENKPKPHRKRKTHRRRNGFEDPNWRQQKGSEKHRPSHPFSHTTTEDEAQQLMEHDLHGISTHRFEDKNVHRRHTVRARSSLSSFFHSQPKETPSSKDNIQIIKKQFDHQPHEVFVELAELQQTVHGMQWKETARWIKYEEDVEGADNRWGKPHIAFLNFNALFSLRKGLERGAVLLDLDERALPSIATRVVDHMVACDQIPPEQRDAVIKILLLRHKHIRESQNAFKKASRGSRLQLLGTSQEKLPTSHSFSALGSDLSRSTRRSLANIFHGNNFSSFANRSSVDESPLPNGDKPGRRNSAFAKIDIESDTETREKKRVMMNLDLLKKLPEGAEATAVLVGAVEFLRQPTIAFVRLAEGVEMENVIEVPIPVRFLFILLGPYHDEMDYHEVGRSISTLMSDKSFHEVAYKAHSRGQLLSAINDFLNASVVFPPSEWRNKDLVPIDEIHAKTQENMRKNEDMRAKKKAMAQLQTKEGKALVGVKPPLHAGSGDDGDSGGDRPPHRDPLKRKGIPFYGLVQDVKIRYSQYLSDFKDGLCPQVLSACIFIFFAALSPTITFGGMYSDLTDRYIGVGETLLVTSVNQAIFALFAAQPLLIIGATGPLMIFDMSLLQFCDGMDLDYLSIRVWVGIWILIIGLLVAAFEAVSVVRTFTRFTEEIFSTLVCVIFIYGAFEKLAVIFKAHPLVTTPVPPPTVSSCLGVLASGKSNLSEVIEFDDDELEYDDDGDDDGNSLRALMNNFTMSNDTDGEDGTVMTNQPNTALLSMCLMLGTFLIAWKLKKFRNSKFLGRGIRRALGDFGVPISIFLMVLLDYLIHDTYTDKLSMPKGLKPSNAEVRGWLINPLGVVDPLPFWCMLAAGPAALLLFVLIFLEENICHLILGKPERCLKKGSGFHLDLVLSCFVNTIAGFLGAPFMGPACVRTIAHMSALTVMSSNVAPGESPKIVGCIEQRVSALVVSILIGLAVMLYAVLNLVPTAVLLGIFLYMGVSATAGIQLLERFVLFFMPVKHHPNVPYVKKVRTRKMHLFTLVQVVMLVILWVVKQSPAALAVPFVLMCLIPIRLYALPMIFSSQEIFALDGGEEKPITEAAEEEPDFYEASHALPSQADLQKLHQS